MIDFLTHLQAWHWIAGGLILMGLELLLPGAFLLWIGLAGLGVGGLSYFLLLSPPIQLLLFAFLSLVCTFVGKRFFKSFGDQKAGKLLGRRADSMVGQEFVLDHPISGGHSRMRVGDSSWAIKGPNLPAGAHVVVIAVEGNHLIVEKASSILPSL